MKKLKLQNLKVIKMTPQEKKTIKGGTQKELVQWDTSKQCNEHSGPFVSWCHECDL